MMSQTLSIAISLINKCVFNFLFKIKDKCLKKMRKIELNIKIKIQNKMTRSVPPHLRHHRLTTINTLYPFEQ